MAANKSACPKSSPFSSVINTVLANPVFSMKPILTHGVFVCQICVLSICENAYFYDSYKIYLLYLKFLKWKIK